MIIALTRRTTDTALEPEAIVPLHVTTVIAQTRWGEEGEQKKKKEDRNLVSLSLHAAPGALTPPARSPVLPPGSTRVTWGSPSARCSRSARPTAEAFLPPGWSRGIHPARLPGQGRRWRAGRPPRGAAGCGTRAPFGPRCCCCCWGRRQGALPRGRAAAAAAPSPRAGPSRGRS